MITLSDATKSIKNRLMDTGSWIVFLTLTSKSGLITIRICNDTQNHAFKGEEYLAFPFKLEEITENNKGEIPSVNLVLSNAQRAVQAYIEQDEDLGSGWEAIIDICHSENLLNPEISYYFTTAEAVTDEKYATFRLQIRNPIRVQFPRIRMLPNACQNTFKRGGCIYSGSDVSCTKTISDCRAKFNNAEKIPFLGFHGIPTTSIYQ